MKLRSLLGLLAVLGVAIGVLSLPGSVSANDGIGPDLDIHVLTPVNGTNTVLVGNNVIVEESVIGPTVDPWVGYNNTYVFDSTALQFISVNDESTPAAWPTSLCLNAPPSNFSGALPPPQMGVIITCSSIGSVPAPINFSGGLSNIVFKAIGVGPTAVHMVEPVEAGPAAGTYATYTINSDATIQTNQYSCTAPGPSGVTVPATSSANPLCPIIPPSPFNSVAIQVINPPPDVALTKTSTTPNIVAGQAASYTISINNPSGTTTATNVQVTDNLPAAMTGAVTFTGANAGTCSVSGPANAQVVSCGPTTIAPGGTFSVNVNVASTDANSGGTSPQNCASVTIAEGDPNTANNTGCTTIQILAPAVSWLKTPTSGNLWLCTVGTACTANSVGQQTNTFSFAEVMQNQGDPNGLGGFSFDVLYDPTQYQAPAIDLSPAVALFAASGRTLDCSITIPQNGRVHVACASTGTIGTGPVFTGNQTMANVTLTPQDSLVEAIRPNKENGDVSVVKDDQVTVTNTCGQPLNDGTSQPVPGQPECQGNPLQGVGPGGVLIGNPNGGQTTQTIRRLEGDVNKDCGVTVVDMQMLASRFGMSQGNLLYNLFYDVSSPLQKGDNEIDINDIQFVYGRSASTCSTPIPAQPAQAAP
ncbi:MAG: DUF11 domain-containing protein [Dehalococcoidia bacterium]|nr:DUF11 domain-containing protein [Dehalococcoidia bacterium]